MIDGQQSNRYPWMLIWVLQAFKRATEQKRIKFIRKFIYFLKHTMII